MPSLSYTFLDKGDVDGKKGDVDGNILPHATSPAEGGDSRQWTMVCGLGAFRAWCWHGFRADVAG